MKVGYNFDLIFPRAICCSNVLTFAPNNLAKGINVLFFIEVRGITNRKTVIEGYENVQAALLDYTLTCYPSVTVSNPR